MSLVVSKLSTSPAESLRHVQVCADKQHADLVFVQSLDSAEQPPVIERAQKT